MKKTLFILIILSVLILAGCDNFSDRSDQGTVNVKLADIGAGRYIAGGGAGVDEAVLGFIEEDVMYNFDAMEDITNFTGEYLFTGIPVGNYAFLAILMSDGDNISTAVQGVTIEPGFNDIIIDMGPGFELTINGNPLEIDDLSSKFTLSFNKDVITIGISKSELTNPMVIEVETNADSMTIRNFDGTPSTDFTVLYSPPLTETDFSTGTITFDGTSVHQMQMILGSPDGSRNVYKMKLEGF